MNALHIHSKTVLIMDISSEEGIIIVVAAQMEYQAKYMMNARHSLRSMNPQVMNIHVISVRMVSFAIMKMEKAMVFVNLVEITKTETVVLIVVFQNLVYMIAGIDAVAAGSSAVALHQIMN